MKFFGNTRLILSQAGWAMIGCMLLPLTSYGVLYQVTQESEPAGFVSSSEAIEGGTTKQSINPTLSSNGYAFGYWAINGVRQAGEGNRSLTQVSTTISANTTFTAHYYNESADTDTDGIMDWYEYRMFGDLSQGPTDDPDSDGFTNKRESELGQDPLIVDEVEWGGISGRLSTGFTYADTSMVLAVVKSDPAGFVTETSNYLETNSTVTTSSLHGATNGFNFAYWSVNGVRQAGPTGVSLSKVSLDVNATTTIIAHYKPSNEDSDSDGVMDWFELYQFGSLDLGPTDDPDGDGFSNKHESELGQEATIADTVEWGGISGRLSTGFTYADTSMVLAVVKSDPAGFVTETSNYLEENSTVTTSSLHGATNGYNFAYWSVNGVRQAGPTGVSLSKVATDVNATTNIVAHYKPSNEDTDEDGVMDWFELYQFGNLNQSGTDDPDGDGFSNKREGELGQEATIADHVEWGGISGRLSPGTLYYQQQNRPPSNLELNNTIVFLNKDANQTVGAFTPTDPDDLGRVRTYTYQLLGGAGGEDNNKFNLLGRNLRASQSLTSEGNFSIQVRVRDDENASFDKNFTIRAIHDPNKDDDSDGLTYAQEQALGTSDTKADTDGDGFGDLQEKVAGSDPTDPNDIIDLNTGLLGWWPLDGNASDISGNDRHGIIQGATASLDRHGWENHGMYFDGSNDRIYVNGPWISGNSPRTVSIWGKSEGLQANFFSLGKGATQGDRFSLLGQTISTSIKFIGQNNGKTFSTPSYHNLWKHFVLTYDGSLGKFYLNKNQVGSFNLGLNTDGTVPFVIGSGPTYKNSEFFKGTLDEVRVYSRVLSGTEVADLYDLESVAPNRPPTDLNSTAVLAVLENLPAGQVIGEFNATDPDLNGSLRYQLVTGEGSEGNAFFTLTQGGVLKSNSTFNYEADKNKSIRVAVLDDKNASMEKSFLINILDMDEGTYPSKGAGTDADPLQIETLSHLSWLSHNSGAWAKSFILMNDINASVTKDWAAGYGFSPIGNGSVRFKGKFNGNGKIIFGLTVNRPYLASVGLFGHLQQGQISNLGIKDGFVSGSTIVGGMAGNLQGSTVVNCFFEGNVTASGQKLGGLVGMSQVSSVIRSCYTTGKVTGTGSRIGGILGQNFTYSKVEDSYSLSKVVGYNSAGGLVGLNSPDTQVNRCFSAGPVTSQGLIGSNQSGFINHSFWDTQASGKSTSAGGLAKTTSQLKDPETFVSVGWNFNLSSPKWKMIRGVTYPKLAWETLENISPSELNSTAQIKFTENLPIGSEIGSFSATDRNYPSEVSFYIPSTSPNRSLFTLDTNGTLKTATTFDYETNASTYTITVQAKDELNATTEGNFTVTLINVNEPPYDLNSTTILTIAENQPVGTFVGEFKAIDPDHGDNLSYRLVKDREQLGNEYFTIDENGTLYSAVSFSFEENQTFHIRVKVSDQDGLLTKESFYVSVIDAKDTGEESDKDGDGFSDKDELEQGTDPNNKFSYPNKPILQTGDSLLNEDGSIDLTGGILEDGKGKITDFGFVISSGISIDPNRSKVLWIRAVGEPKQFKLKLTQSPYQPIFYFRAWAKNIAGYGIGPVRKVRIPEAPKPWWGEVQERPGGWKTSDWFGNFISYEKGWLYHARLGWLYSSPASESSVWLWKEKRGWLWTKEDAWPYFWSHQSGGWLYLYLGGLEGTPRFYDYSTQSYR